MNSSVEFWATNLKKRRRPGSRVTLALGPAAVAPRGPLASVRSFCAWNVCCSHPCFPPVLAEGGSLLLCPWHRMAAGIALFRWRWHWRRPRPVRAYGPPGMQGACVWFEAEECDLVLPRTGSRLTLRVTWSPPALWWRPCPTSGPHRGWGGGVSAPCISSVGRSVLRRGLPCSKSFCGKTQELVV